MKARYSLIVTRIDAVHALQNAYMLEGGAPEAFVLPNYDMERYETLFKIVQLLVAFAGKDTIGAMGKRGEIDSQRLRTVRFERLIGDFRLDVNPSEVSVHYIHSLGSERRLLHDFSNGPLLYFVSSSDRFLCR